MKGLWGFLFRDKHRIPPMSLAEILFGVMSISFVIFLIVSVLF
jgi:hypothetical protein